jgi:hypothetical protein
MQMARLVGLLSVVRQAPRHWSLALGLGTGLLVVVAPSLQSQEPPPPKAARAAAANMASNTRVQAQAKSLMAQLPLRFEADPQVRFLSRGATYLSKTNTIYGFRITLKDGSTIQFQYG